MAGPNEYLLCVNASNRDKIHSWLLEQGSHVPGCRIHDRSAEIAQIALQGPATRAVVATFGSTALDALKLRESTMVTIESVPCLVARTGYTGEFGYEFYVYGPPARVWNALLDRGQYAGVKRAGLGARDRLRLEMGYLLYGNDIDEATTPIEAGVEWAVSFTKGDFIGRDALWAQKQAGPGRRFIAFELLEKGVPRHGFKILDPATSKPVGDVSSGNLSPRLQKGIGLEGEKLRLVITRKTDRTCATEIVVKEHGINAKLPLGKTVTVEFTPTKSGELRYACGMGHVTGVVFIP